MPVSGPTPEQLRAGRERAAQISWLALSNMKSRGVEEEGSLEAYVAFLRGRVPGATCPEEAAYLLALADRVLQ